MDAQNMEQKNNIKELFITLSMKKGKRDKKEKLYKKCQIQLKNMIQRRTFKNAIKDVQQTIELKSVKIRGNLFQIPYELTKTEAKKQTLKLFLKCTTKSKENTLQKKLTNEIQDIITQKTTNNTLRERNEIHMQGEKIKNFTH